MRFYPAIVADQREAIAAWGVCVAIAAVFVGFAAVHEVPAADAIDPACDTNLTEEASDPAIRIGLPSIGDEDETVTANEDAGTIRRRAMGVLSLPSAARRQSRE